MLNTDRRVVNTQIVFTRQGRASNMPDREIITMITIASASKTRREAQKHMHQNYKYYSGYQLGRGVGFDTYLAAPTDEESGDQCMATEEGIGTHIGIKNISEVADG